MRAPQPLKHHLSVTAGTLLLVFKVDSDNDKLCCPVSQLATPGKSNWAECRIWKSYFVKRGALILPLCFFQRPNDSSINGMLTGYRLYYRELPVNTSTFTEAEVMATKNNTTSVLITSEFYFFFQAPPSMFPVSIPVRLSVLVNQLCSL